MPDRPSNKLIRTIEGEIVPRLLLSFAGSLAASAGAEPTRAGDIDPVAEFARLLRERAGDGAGATTATRVR